MLGRLKAKVAQLWPWRVDASGLRYRRYPSDKTYRAHQARKVHGLDLDAHDARFRQQLTERFATQPPQSPVLCLGARNGAEVQAFRDLGAWAIGVDLASSVPTPLVVRGDFHYLPFRSHSVRTVFSNAIDHARDLSAYLSEVRRVLRRDGVFLLDAVNVARTEAGTYESLWWPSTDVLVSRIQAEGFTLLTRRDGKNWINLQFRPT